MRAAYLSDPGVITNYFGLQFLMKDDFDINISFVKNNIDKDIYLAKNYIDKYISLDKN